MSDLERVVTLLCPLCGGDQFESPDEAVKDFSDADEDVRVYCSGCGSEYTIRELIENNAPIIDQTVEALLHDFIKEMEKRLNGQ